MHTDKMTSDDIISLLNLSPLPGEGGYFRETYRSQDNITVEMKSGKVLKKRNLSTAIYYMITPISFSHLHVLPQDEIFHFYLGDPAEMLLIYEDGSHELIVVGPDLSKGQKLQVLVPANTWQGTKIKADSIENGYTLLGTTVAPSFQFEDMGLLPRPELIRLYPDKKELIEKYTQI